MKFIKKIIVESLREYFKEIPTPPSTIEIDVSILPQVSNGLNQREKKLLESLSGDTDFISLLGKIEYGLALGSMNCRSELDIAEIRGGQKVLKALSDQLVSNRSKSLFNPISGEKIS